MFTWVYIYIYICTYVTYRECMNVYIYIHIYVYIICIHMLHMNIYVNMYLYHLYTQIHLYAYIYVFKYVYMHVYVHWYLRGRYRPQDHSGIFTPWDPRFGHQKRRFWIQHYVLWKGFDIVSCFFEISLCRQVVTLETR